MAVNSPFILGRVYRKIGHFLLEHHHNPPGGADSTTSSWFVYREWPHVFDDEPLVLTTTILDSLTLAIIDCGRDTLRQASLAVRRSLRDTAFEQRSVYDDSLLKATNPAHCSDFTGMLSQ